MKLSLILAAILLCPLTFAKTSHLRKRPVGPPHETDEQIEEVRLYALDSLIKAWNDNIHSGKDIDSILPKTMDEKKRKDLHASLDNMGPAAVITRNGYDLTFETSTTKAVLHWPRHGQTAMIAGGITFAYDTSVGVMQNMKMFDQRMGINDQSAANSFPLHLLLPDAEAANPVKLFQVMVKSKTGEWIVSTFKKLKCSSTICTQLFGWAGMGTYFSSDSAKCWLISSLRPWTWATHPVCLEYKKEADAHQALATTTLLKETAEADGKTWAARGWQCPKIDKDTYEYTSWMRQVQVIDDNHSQELGSWRFYKAKFSKANNPKLIDIKVFATEEDSKKSDVNAPLYKLSFDPDSPTPMLTSIQSRVDSVSDSSEVGWKTILVADANLPDYRDIWGRNQSLAEGTLKSYNVCQYVKFMNQFDPSGVKSDLQSALSKPGAPVPAAASEQATTPGAAPAPDAKK